MTTVSTHPHAPITGLERSGWLVKTAVTVPGPFGRPEHAWRLAAATQRKAA